VDAFGTDEVTFVTLLKGNWLMGILLPHKPFLLDRCPVSGSLVGIPRWLPVDGFEVLQQCSPCKKTDVFCHSNYLISLFDVLERCSETSQPIR
jgi:hypothetical protein